MAEGKAALNEEAVRRSCRRLSPAPPPAPMPGHRVGETLSASGTIQELAFGSGATASLAGSQLPINGLGNGGDTIAAGSIDGHLHDFRISKGLTRFPFIPEKQTLTTTNSQRSGVSVTASNVTLLTCHAATITDGIVILLT